SCLRAFSSSRKANRTLVRFASEVSRQAGNASAAAVIADSTVAFEPSATWPLTTPVAGFVISPRRVSVLAVTVCPLIQWERVGIGVLLRRRWFGGLRLPSSLPCAVVSGCNIGSECPYTVSMDARSFVRHTDSSAAGKDSPGMAEVGSPGAAEQDSGEG